MGRWKGYFDKLLNGENHRFVSEHGVPNDGLTQGIGRNLLRLLHLNPTFMWGRCMMTYASM